MLSKNHAFNPSFYVRYVDDTLATFSSQSHIQSFISELKSNSCLNFTYETPTKEYFNFLDIEFKVRNGKIETGIYIKSTDKGLYFDYSSHIPQNYKISLVKILVHRAYRLCSTWDLFHKEVERITKNLINNNFPQSVVQKTIMETIEKLYQPKQDIDSNTQPITFYFRVTDLNTFIGDKVFLKQAIAKHITPNDPTRRIDLRIYYKPRKMSSCFSLRPKRPELQRHGLVYQFQCNEDGCNSSYIGYTSNSLQTRARQHRYAGSKIFAHYDQDHHSKPGDISDQFSILYTNSDIRNVKIAEALLIRENMPVINVRFNEMSSGLKVFR